jgi:hypothetical protein
MNDLVYYFLVGTAQVETPDSDWRTGFQIDTRYNVCTYY